MRCPGQCEKPQVPQQPVQAASAGKSLPPQQPNKEKDFRVNVTKKSHPAACPICSTKGGAVAALCQELNLCPGVPAHQNHPPGSGFSSAYGK